jgi:molecular chaperone DnaK
LAHSTEKTIRDNAEKVPAEEKAAAEAAIVEARTAMEGGELDAINAATEKLSQASMKLGEAMYKAEQASASAAQPAPDATAPNGEKVVDADFEDMDPKKKQG